MSSPGSYIDGCASSCSATQACLSCPSAGIYSCFDASLTYCCGCYNGVCAACATSAACIEDHSQPSHWACKAKFSMNVGEIIVLCVMALFVIAGLSVCIFFIYRRRRQAAQPEAIVVSSSNYGSISSSPGLDHYSNYDTPTMDPKASTYDKSARHSSKGYQQI